MSQEESIFNSLIEEDDITWQSMIIELVKTEQMDLWDVDIGLLSEKLISFLNEMKETNLRVSGKMILASAILLRLKSGKFVDSDLVNLENMMNLDEYEEFEDFGEFGSNNQWEKANPKDFKIYPRTPQPRKRKVSIYDLLDSLGKVLNNKKERMRKKVPSLAPDVKVRKHVDINLVIKDVEKALFEFKEKNNTNTMKFSEIIPSERKEDKIQTFIPLLHLTNQRVTDLEQEEHFSDFKINILKESSRITNKSKL